MTTIAFDGKSIASDSGVWADETMICRMTKLHRLKNGSVVGFCGDAKEWLPAIQWLEGETENDKAKLGLCMLVVSPKGKITQYEGTTPIRVSRTKYIAIGTGSAIALGALHHGATAVEAVRAAIAHDSKSVGPIISLKL